MVQLSPAPGKLPADGKEIIPTDLLQDGAVTPVKQSAGGKLKRASSNKLDTNVQHAAAGLLYTTVAITITKAIVYAATTIAAGNMILDVGINGDDNAIVDGAAITGKTNDTVTVLTIVNGAVAAGKMVTASVKTASGDASQSVVVAIEYYDNT